jgi:hypothetical protein
MYSKKHEIDLTTATITEIFTQKYGKKGRKRIGTLINDLYFTCHDHQWWSKDAQAFDPDVWDQIKDIVNRIEICDSGELRAEEFPKLKVIRYISGKDAINHGYIIHPTYGDIFIIPLEYWSKPKKNEA